MRLKRSRVSTEEELTRLLADGHRLLQDTQTSKHAGSFDPDIQERAASAWRNVVSEALLTLFPTDLEKNLFANANPLRPFRAGDDHPFFRATKRLGEQLDALNKILTDHLPRYTDLPINERLYVEDIDSFSKVRDVNPDMTTQFLDAGGFLDCPEDSVQMALEQILDVPFHKKDWGGEINDLYTANLTVAGARRATAFLLKGPGTGRKQMTIADCGKNGDQIVRLFSSAADLFVIQYVGPIAEAVVADAQGKARERRLARSDCHFLIIDGQDTARLLFAYGRLPRRR